MRRVVALDKLGRRRDRKRRNQRIAAGVVGLAVFVAAVLIGGMVGVSDRTQGPAGEGTTGPSETVPTETGPTVHEKADGSGYRIPPAGTAVSTPVQGELIAKTDSSTRVTGYVIRVYADGRVLWWVWEGLPPSPDFVERRLSPEGVELLRADVTRGDASPQDFERPGDLLELLESGWEDRQDKPYVPARYRVCWHSGEPLEAVLDLLPASAQVLLRAGDPAVNPQCLEVTPEEARSLEEILGEAGSSRRSSPYAVGTWLLRDGKGDQVGISLEPLYPDGHKFVRPAW